MAKFKHETAFTRYLTVKKGLALKTVEDRLRLWRYLKRRCPNFNENEISELLYKLRSEGKKVTYLNLIRDTARHYVAFLQDKGLPCDAKVLQLPWMRPQEPVKAIFTDEEIERFLSYPFHNLTWKTYWNLLIFTGARPIEIALLEVEDFDLVTRMLTIKRSKTKRPRTVPIPPNAQHLVEALVKEKGKGRLFPTTSQKSWGWWWRRIVKEIGIQKRTGLTCYSFRHTYITSLVRANVALPKIQALVGHASLAMTERYTHLVEKDISEAVLEHPLIKKYTEAEVKTEKPVEKPEPANVFWQPKGIAEA